MHAFVSNPTTSYAPGTRSELVCRLLELIAALDRRVPQSRRHGEDAIVREAAALKAQALARLETLDHDFTITDHDFTITATRNL